MSGYTANAWKTIASGGRWTVTEVQRACPCDSPKLIENAIRNMVLSGMVRRFEGGSVLKYGVTPDCKIPQGLTVEEVMKVMQE